MKEYNGYRCNNARLRSCSFPHQLSERKIEKQLLQMLRSELEQYVISSEAVAAEKRRQPKVHDIVALNEQLRRFNIIYIAGNISDDEYAIETKKLKAEIEKAKSTESHDRPVDLTKIKSLLETDFISVYHSLNKEDQRRFWRSIIEEIYIDKTTVTGIKPRI